LKFEILKNSEKEGKVSKKFKLALAVVVAVALVAIPLLSSCAAPEEPAPPAPPTEEKPPVEKPPPEDVLVGATIAITGKGAYAGQTLLLGAEMAIDEINAAGGIKSLGGAKIRLIKADSQTEPKIAGIVTEGLITRDKVSVLWGEYSTGATLIATEVAEKHGVPMLCVAGTKIITDRGLKYTFRTNPYVDYWGEIGIQMKQELGVKTVAILTDDSGFGGFIRAMYQGLCEKYGMEIVLDEVHKAATLDLSPALLKIGAAKPDALLGGAYLGDAILMIKQMKELDVIVPLNIGTATGFADVDFWESTGGDGEYCMASGTYHHSSTLPENVKFVAAFEKRYGFKPDLHMQWGYTDMMVIADALERAASRDPKVIRDALTATDMVAPVGRVKFGPDGQNHEVLGNIAQWLNGQQECIYPRDVATAEIVYPMPTWAERS